jgi:hypothetical protein
MGSHRRSVLAAAAWLAVAAAAGVLAAFLLRPDPVVIVRYAERDGGDPAPLAADLPARAGSARAGSSAPAGDPAAEGSLPPSGDRTAPASLAVTVADAEGTRVHAGGMVYALDPGAAGGEDEEDFCRAEVSQEGTAVLRLPGPGTYDIGYSGSWGTTVVPDVYVPAGDGATLDLRLPGDRPVHVRCEPPWPPPADRLQVKVRLASEQDPADVAFPGRGQVGRAYAEIAPGPDGTGTSRPLPSDRTFAVSASVTELLPFLGARDAAGNLAVISQVSPRYVLVPDPATVRPGETARLRLRVGAAIVVEFRPAWTVPLPQGKQNDLGFTVVLRQGEAAQWRAFTARNLHTPPSLRFHYPAQPGPCRIEWSGTGVLAGSLEDVVLKSGEIAERVIPVHQDPTGKPTPLPSPPTTPTSPGTAAPILVPPPPVPLTVEGIPEGGTAYVIGLRLEPDGDESWHQGEVESGKPSMDLGDPWNGYPTILSLLPPALASDVVPATAPGPIRVTLRPAGLLLVATEEAYPAEWGRLRLRLPGKRPIPIAGRGGRGIEEIRSEPVVETGTLVGPLPEGTWVFEVRLGGVRLPEATATVRAGRIEVLRIRR